jgi:anti-sigma factor ChrR (cupin superfamily)
VARGGGDAWAGKGEDATPAKKSLARRAAVIISSSIQGRNAMSPSLSTAEARNDDRSLASTMVDVVAMRWTPTKYPGIDVKVLLEDKSTGLLTALFRWAPGAVLPDHEHTRTEQTFVLEGSLADHEGVVTAGNYVSRPAGSRHVAHSPDGALTLAFFLQPNVFFGPNGEREVFATAKA